MPMCFCDTFAKPFIFSVSTQGATTIAVVAFTMPMAQENKTDRMLFLARSLVAYPHGPRRWYHKCIKMFSFFWYFHIRITSGGRGGEKRSLLDNPDQAIHRFRVFLTYFKQVNRQISSLETREKVCQEAVGRQPRGGLDSTYSRYSILGRIVAKQTLNVFQIQTQLTRKAKMGERKKEMRGMDGGEKERRTRARWDDRLVSHICVCIYT